MSQRTEDTANPPSQRYAVEVERTEDGAHAEARVRDNLARLIELVRNGTVHGTLRNGPVPVEGRWDRL